MSCDIYQIHCNKLQILDINFKYTVQRRGDMVTWRGCSHLCGRRPGRGADIGQSSGNSRTYRGADATKQDSPPNKKFHGHYFETRAHLNRERHLCACTSFVEPLVATHGVRGECPYRPLSSSAVAPSLSRMRESLFFRLWKEGTYSPLV